LINFNPFEQIGWDTPALWLISLPAIFNQAPDYACLDNDEQQRGSRFLYDKHKDRFLASHLAQRLILAQYLKIKPAEIQFDFHPLGKPYLKDSSLQFNLSHSGDYALLGVQQETAIGVDIELMAPRDYIGLANHVFSAEEINVVESQSETNRATYFYRIWAQKEAYIKYTGKGLREALDAFTVTTEPGAATITHLGKKQSLNLYNQALFDKYQLAVCSDKSLCDITGIEFCLEDFSR